ncbi:hypothetical protein [Rhodoferax sp. GW822-FHT02A01]|uniref:hypothetical protein n=1 Tax=Rhodoferax sp. GW822-FHT02A01 TaxID=3141537 RepID=UPI00315D1C96
MTTTTEPKPDLMALADILNPYPEGSPRSAWRAGFLGTTNFGAKGSDNDLQWRQGSAARKTLTPFLPALTAQSQALEEAHHLNTCIPEMREEIVHLNAKLADALAEVEKLNCVINLLTDGEERVALLIVEHADLRTRCEALEKDAARYRWLRNDTLVDGEVNEEIHVACDGPKFLNAWALFGESLDAAIDAALLEQKNDQ